MANRFCNLVGGNNIKDEYNKVTEGFDDVETEIDAEVSARDSADTAQVTRMDAHVAATAELHSASDITNDSSVTGAKVDVALEGLKALIDVITTGDSNAAIGLYDMIGSGVDTITATYTDLVNFAGMKILLVTAGPNLTETPSVNINAQGALNIKVFDSSGSKVNPRIGIMPEIAMLYHDGTDLILVNGMNANYSDETTSTAELTSLPSVGIKKGKLELEFRGSSLQQLVGNGNFASGTSGWNSSVAVNSVSDNIMSSTGDGGGAIPVLQSSITVEVGDIFFVYTKVRVTNSDCSKIEINEPFNEIIGSPLINTWYELYKKDTTLYSRLWVKHYYADAATANGKVMEIDGNAGVMAYNLTAMGTDNNGVAYVDYTEAELLDMVRGAYIEGVQGAEPCEVSCLGKNSFDKNSAVLGERINESTGVELASSASFRSDFLKIDSSTQYIISGHGSLDIRYALFDEHKNYLAGAQSNSFTTTSLSKFIKISDLQTKINSIQIEKGATATTYEPFTKSTIKTPNRTYHSVPAAYDWFNPGDGVDHQACGEHYLVSGDISDLSNRTNSQRVRITLDNFDGVGGTTITGGVIFLDWFESTYAICEAGTVNNVGYYSNADYIDLYYEPGTYADLAAAQAELVGRKIIYQLAAPIIKKYAPQIINSNVSGTIINTLLSENSTRGELAFSYPTNPEGQADSLATQILTLSTKVDTPSFDPEQEGVGSIIPLPKSAVKGKLDLEFRGNSLQQLVGNGNFADGITGWIASSGSLSASNNVLSNTADGSGLAPYSNHVNVPFPVSAGDKLFVYVKARVTNSSCDKLRFYHVATGDTDNYLNILNPTINVWYEGYTITELTVNDATTWVQVTNEYADAATANGKVLEIQDTMAINMTALGLESKTEAEMLAMVRGAYIEGLQGAEPCEVSCIGKNLFDGEYQIGYVNVGNSFVEDGANTDVRYISFYTKVNAGTYTFSFSEHVDIVRECDEDGVSVGMSENDKTEYTMVLTKGGYIGLSIRDDVDSVWSDRDIQLEKGSTATTYEPFTKSTIKTPNRTYHSLPNRVYDYYNFGDGVDYKAISDDKGQEIIDTSTWLVASVDTDTVRFRQSTSTIGLDNVAEDLSAGHANMTIDSSYFPSYAHSDLSNDDYEGCSFDDASRFVLRILKSKLASNDSAGLVSYLSGVGVELFYQLAAPITTNYPKQNLIAEKDGTIYNEFHKTQRTPYKTTGGIRVKDVNFPIASLVEVKKIEASTGEETNILIADCTIVAGGLTYTSTALTEGDIVETKYAYEFLSTRGRVAFKTPVNTKAQSDSNTAMIGGLEDKINSAILGINSRVLMVNYFVEATGLSGGFSGVAMFQAPGNLDVIITKITMMRQGAFVGVDGSNPFTVNITNNNIDTVATKLFTSAPGTTEDITVALEFQKLVSGDKLNLAHTYGGTANPPNVTYQIEYVIL